MSHTLPSIVMPCVFTQDRSHKYGSDPYLPTSVRSDGTSIPEFLPETFLYNMNLNVVESSGGRGESLLIPHELASAVSPPPLHHVLHSCNMCSNTCQPSSGLLHNP